MTEYRTKRRFLDTVQSRLPGLTLPAVDLELKNTLNDFFTRSTVWRARITVNTQAGIPDYELLPPDTQSKILNVLYADLNGQPVRYSIMVPRTVVLDTAPQTSEFDALAFIVSLTLDDSICEDPACDNFIPDFVYDYWYETVLDGTLGRLYGAPKKPYTDVARAAYHLRRYENGIGSARTMADASYTRGYARWRFPKAFVGPSNQRYRMPRG